MKIGFFEIKPWEKEYLHKKLKKYNLKFFKEPLNEKNVEQASDCEIISIFIYSKIGKKMLQKLPKLKLIATRSTGYDHIDIKECRKRKIIVTYVPFYGENTVAEHTFALILTLSRNIHKSYIGTLKVSDLTGFDLKDKTIGIVGGGNIGMHVAKIAKGFQMKILVYDIVKKKKLSKVIGFSYVGLDKLLKKSDVITLHVPYNKFTHHLINKSKFNLMKKGAILINTSRGGVVDTNALLFALDKGILAGVGLDVIEGEELVRKEKQLLHKGDNLGKLRKVVRNRKIFKRGNVVFTSHNAFNSKEALIRILDTTIENITSKNKLKEVVR